MSLESRLIALAQAVGADVKALVNKDFGHELELGGLSSDVSGMDQRLTQLETQPATVPMPEAWHEVGASGEPAFGAGWGNYSTAPGYGRVEFRKWNHGLVEIRGSAKSVAGAVSGVFVLPEGYCPLVGEQSGYGRSTFMSKAGVVTNGHGLISISPAGVVNVYLYVGTTQQFSPFTAVNLNVEFYAV